MEGNGTLTVKEVISLTGLSHNTIYRYIRQGKLKTYTILKSGKRIKALYEDEVKKVLLPVNNDNNMIITGVNNRLKPNSKNLDNAEGKDFNQLITDNNQLLTGVKTCENLTLELIEETIQRVIKNEQTALLKPLEEQSIFIAGKLSSENQFLKQRLETVIQELEQYKALPAQVEKEKEQALKILQGEKSELESRVMDLQKEQEALKLQAIQEKEEALKELEARLKAEAEEAQKLIVDAWKKELEQARKPWYRKIFS